MKTKDSPDFALIRSVAEHATLLSVNCTKSCVHRVIGREDAQPPFDAEIETATTHEYAPDTGTLTIRASMKLSGFEHPPSKKKTRRLVMEADACFELTYLIADLDAADISDEGLSQFSQVNGLYNAWPFLREAIHSNTAKVGMPPFMVPLFRM